MALPAGRKREMEQLKTLLFQSEEERLEALEVDVASLRRYVGGADRLEQATAEVLVAALERAEADRPRELSNAITPSVVAAIRREIENSRELMVDALYPITGRMVAAAVKNAFGELLSYLEQRLNALTSAELWVGRAKSLATGRPISEFVLAGGQSLRVDRLLMIERGSGILVADWTREGEADERADLLSAMVAAILEFSGQALAGEDDLQKLDFGGRQIALRASPRFILAAECSGPLRAADDTRINSLFFDTIERIDNGSECDAEMLGALADAVEDAPTPGKKEDVGGKVVMFALLVLGTMALAWQAGTWVTRATLEQRVHAAFERTVSEASLPAGFPLRLEFDHDSENVVVTGIQPSGVDIGSLVSELTAPAAPYEVTDNVGVVPGHEEIAALNAEIAALRQSLARMQARAGESGGTDIAGTSGNRWYSGLNGSAMHLDSYLASTAILFGTSGEFADEARADRQIRDLGALLADTDREIRLVAHVEGGRAESGSRTRALQRAEKVRQRLISLGVEPSRLSAVSRPLPARGEARAADGAYRRVIFENAFPTEAAQ